MKLRQIASHNFRVLAMLEPVAGESVLAVLNDARRFHGRLYIQMTAALRGHTPVFGPPWEETGHGVAKAKRLFDGISEFIARNQEASRRQRARQSRDEKNLGLRIFFFEYGRDVICTNACYKTQMTPEEAVPAAFLARDTYFAYLATGNQPRIEGAEGD
jgi:hypothetical protein